MCGIAGFISLNEQTLANGEKVLKCMGSFWPIVDLMAMGLGWMTLARSGWLIVPFDHRSEFCRGSAHEG